MVDRLIEATTSSDVNYIGIDGCSKGWVCAIISKNILSVKLYSSIDSIISGVSTCNVILIDMPIGLPSNQYHERPDNIARRVISKRASSIFPVPCRQAVYAPSANQAYLENERILGKKFTPLTLGIIPKIREIDEFLQNNQKYKNKIFESHPEVCFSRLNGETVMSKKNSLFGIVERIRILNNYIPDIDVNLIAKYEQECNCNADDVLDAIVLAYTATLSVEGKTESIHADNYIDDAGIKMQMIIPVF